MGKKGCNNADVYNNGMRVVWVVSVTGAPLAGRFKERRRSMPWAAYLICFKEYRKQSKVRSYLSFVVKHPRKKIDRFNATR